MRYLLIFFSFSLSFAVSCTSKKDPESVTKTKTKTVKIATDLRASQYMTIYFSGQPTEENFLELKKSGFTTVINLREDGEGAYSERAERDAVNAAELNYFHIPMNANAQLDDPIIQKITAKVRENRKSGKILVHCGSGNRAALWAGGHFFRDHKFKAHEAMSIAKSLGLTSPKLQENLEEYLNK